MLIMLNKPAGVLTARGDRTRPTVMGLLPAEYQGLHPVGRLDMDTEGLLLLTDDGRLDPLLLRPEAHVEKVYFFRAFGRLEEEDFARMAAGVVLEGSGVTSLPARAWLAGYSTIGACEALLPPKKHNHLMKNPHRPVTEGYLALREGRKHQVKLMVKAVGGHVFTLKRLSIGSLALDPALAPGAFRPLTQEETEALFNRQGVDLEGVLAGRLPAPQGDSTMQLAEYRVRRVTEAELPLVLDLCRGNPLFFEFCPPAATEVSLRADLEALPPGKTPADKYYLGFWDGDRLAAVLDLILGYPDPATAWIGFFMTDRSLQGRGVGTRIIQALCSLLAERGFRGVRLGWMAGNPQAEAFWKKNGFTETGRRSPRDGGVVVEAEKELAPPGEAPEQSEQRRNER